MELRVISNGGDANILNAAYETTTTSQQLQDQDYDEVVGVSGRPENTVLTTSLENEDHAYDFIPGDTP